MTTYVPPSQRRQNAQRNQHQCNTKNSFRKQNGAPVVKRQPAFGSKEFQALYPTLGNNKKCLLPPPSINFSDCFNSDDNDESIADNEIDMLLPNGWITLQLRPSNEKTCNEVREKIAVEPDANMKKFALLRESMLDHVKTLRKRRLEQNQEYREERWEFYEPLLNQLPEGYGPLDDEKCEEEYGEEEYGEEEYGEEEYGKEKYGEEEYETGNCCA